MAEKLKIFLHYPHLLFGSEEYTIVVEVTNLTDKTLTDVVVEPQLLPGIPRSLKESPSYSEIDELEEQKRSLVRELEEQVVLAYEVEKEKKLPLHLSLLYNYSRAMNELFDFSSLGSIFAKRSQYHYSLPPWAQEAFRISEWPDVERLEQDVVNNVPPDSFLKKAFLINKEKLQRCLAKIAHAKNAEITNINLVESTTVHSGESIKFPFRYRAPHLYRERSYDVQFKISYRDPGKNTISNYFCSDTLSFSASPLSVLLGAVIGAFIGFIVKMIFVSQSEWFSKSFFAYLFGSILLSIIVAFFTVRSPNDKKLFTTEDFVGGFVIGALSGLFSEKLLEYLSTFIPKTGQVA